MSTTLIIVIGDNSTHTSTVARALAKHFQYSFIEADDFLSTSAKVRIAAGKPLNSALLAPWITTLKLEVEVRLQRGSNCIMSYSCLRADCRIPFRGIAERTLFIRLVTQATTTEAQSNILYMPTKRFRNQAAQLDVNLDVNIEETDVVNVNISHAIDAVVDQAAIEILKYLHQRN